MRRHLVFDCQGAKLAATLDDTEGKSGLLLVNGGNEIRSGAFSGQAELAQKIAEAGFPVFRFDRRGVGDSEGGNGGFRTSGPDIAAAVDSFRSECPELERIVGFGNCDGASALMLAGGTGLDRLILSNPWTIEEDDTPLPSEAVRAHYRQRLADPAAIKRLLTGQVSLGKLFESLRAALRPKSAPSTLAQEIAAGIADFEGEIRFLIADRDRTAQAFLANWRKDDPHIRTCKNATHGYVEAHAREWLSEQILEVLRD